MLETQMGCRLIKPQLLTISMARGRATQEIKADQQLQLHVVTAAMHRVIEPQTVNVQKTWFAKIVKGPGTGTDILDIALCR